MWETTLADDREFRPLNCFDQLYPGGVREVLKLKGEEYSLHWGGSVAPFSRLAAKFGAVVVPFAIVGADDAYSLAVDTKEILESPAGPFLRDLIGTL